MAIEIDDVAMELAKAISEKNLIQLREDIVTAFGIKSNHWYVDTEAEILEKKLARFVLETVAWGLEEEYERQEIEEQEIQKAEAEEGNSDGKAKKIVH